MKSVIVLLILLQIDSAIANCKPVRLDDKGGPFEKMPVYNQKQFSKIDPGICYAITTAQLIDADRFYRGESLEKLTSPVSIASNTKLTSRFKEKPGAKSLNGDEIYTALQAAKKTKTCDQKYLERYASLIDESIPSHFYTASKRNTSVANLLESMREHREQSEKLKRFDSMESASCTNNYIMSRLGSDKNTKDIQNVLQKNLHEQTFEGQISASLRDLCQGHEVEVPDIRIKTSNGYTDQENQIVADIFRYSIIEGFFSQPELEQEITRLQALKKITEEETSSLELYKSDLALLKKYKGADIDAEVKKLQSAKNGRMTAKIKDLLGSPTPVPIGIGYHTNLIIGKNGGRHASALIGQRPTPDGKCEFLIRDSYGNNCAGYTVPCNRGNVWVSEENLEKHLEDINWIER